MEIKFNLWDIEREQYFRDVLSLENNKINKWGTLEKRTSNNVEWLQFTGIKDKEGVEIYNGDILDAGDRIVKVSWNKYCGQWDTYFIAYKGIKNSNGLQNNEWIYRATVIGNIYQNKELLSANYDGCH